MSQAWIDQVDRFCRQYFQLETKLDLPQDTFLRLPEVQEAIFRNLFADGAVIYGPPVRYQVRNLKYLVSRIEASIEDWDQHEVSENLMSALSVLLSTPQPPETLLVQQRFYVTYNLSALPGDPNSASSKEQDPHITLLENRSLISAGGTTGLRTWEAGLHMGQFLCQNPDVVRGKRVLELGAGTGYISILCANYLGATHVLASDGSDDVINHLPENLFLNDLQDSARISLADVKWGHALVGTEEEVWNGGRPVDVVLGADVTYDRSAIPALVGTLLDLFALHPAVEVYISATQRNEKTSDVFLKTCADNGLVTEDLEFGVPSRPSQRGPFYDDQVPITIFTCKVSRYNS